MIVIAILMLLVTAGAVGAAHPSQSAANSAVTLVGAVGGDITAIAANEGVVFVGEGPRFRAYEAGVSANVLGSAPPVPGKIADIAVAGHQAFLAVPGVGLGVVNVADPTTLRHMATHASPGRYMRVTAASGMVFVCGSWREPAGEHQIVSRLTALEMGDVAAPVERFALDLCGPMVADEQHLYMLEFGYGLRIFATTGVHAGAQVGELPLPTAEDSLRRGDLALDGTTALVAAHGLHAVDVSDPAHPAVLGTLRGVVDGRSIALGGGVAYIVGLRMVRNVPDGGTHRVMDSGVAIIDLSVPHEMHMQTLEAITVCCEIGAVDELAFAGGPQLVAINARKAPTRAVSLTMLTEPWVLRSGMAPHGATLFATSTENRGLRIDVADPGRPKVRGSFEAKGSVRRLHVAGDRLYAATVALTGTGRLWIGPLNELGQPTWVGSYEPVEAMPPWTNTSVTDLVVHDATAYLSVAAVNRSGWYESRLEIVNVATAAAPAVLGSLKLQGDASCSISDTRVYVHEARAYLVGANCLWIVDIADPGEPLLLGRHALADAPPGWSALDAAVFGTYVVVPSTHGMTVLDAANPRSIQAIAEMALPDFGYLTPTLAAGSLQGSPCVAIADARALWVVDMTDPTQPRPIGRHVGHSDLDGSSWRFLHALIHDNYVYVATATGGVHALSVGSAFVNLSHAVVLPYTSR